MAQPDHVPLHDGVVELLAAQTARIADLEAQLAARAEVDVLVAHEVRTPLTVILGGIETALALRDGHPELRPLLARMLRQAQGLRAVVEVLLSPVSPGGTHSRAPQETVALAEVVEDALDAVSLRLPRRRVVVEGVAGLRVRTSPARLTAILVNLLENAARYGGTGPVEVRAELRRRWALRIFVADRGPGLRGLDPEELFEPYRQGPNAHREGRGLGLYLVRQLARSLGGDATLADRPGGGAVATVSLPQRRTDDPAPPDHEGHAGAAARTREGERADAVALGSARQDRG
jgi:signal transduction histidine kinase